MLEIAELSPEMAFRDSVPDEMLTPGTPGRVSVGPHLTPPVLWCFLTSALLVQAFNEELFPFQWGGVLLLSSTLAIQDPLSSSGILSSLPVILQSVPGKLSREDPCCGVLAHSLQHVFGNINMVICSVRGL